MWLSSLSRGERDSEVKTESTKGRCDGDREVAASFGSAKAFASMILTKSMMQCSLLAFSDLISICVASSNAIV